MPKSDLSLLDRYHKNLLYGGGIIFSILVIVVMMMGLLMEFSGFIDERKSDFSNRKMQIVVEMETRQMALLRSMVAAEALWRRQHQPRLRPRLWQEGEGLPGQVVPWVLQGRTALEFSDDEDYLDILDELAYLANSSFFSYGRSAFPSYIFSKNEEFIAALLPGDMSGVDYHQMLQDIRSQIAQIKHDKAKMALLREPRQSVWMEPSKSLLTGKKSFRIAASAFHDEKPFISVVNDFPVSLLEILLANKDDEGEYFILNASGNVILGDAEFSGENPERFMFLLKNRRQTDFLARYDWGGHGWVYVNGHFHLLSDLSNSGMQLLHVVSWTDALDVLKDRIFIYWASAFFWIILLWVFFIYFNQKVFAPIYEKSRSVFDSENLSRTLISTAPYGLGIFSMKERRNLLENDLMKKYRKSHIKDNERGRRSLTDFFYEIHERESRRKKLWNEKTLTKEVEVEIDGATTELSITMANVHYQGSRVLLCGFSDITSHKQIERKMEEARIAAENANQAKSSFLASMSHEIRTPLSAILGNLEILGRTRLSSAQKDRLKIIISSSNSLLALLSDILDFSKIESGAMVVDKEDFDLRKILHQVANIYSSLAVDMGLEFFLNIDDSIADAYCGDGVRIKQILNNLLSNAIKFTGNGWIRLNAREENDMLHIEVADSGIGIHDSQHGLIFDAFKQVHQEHSHRLSGAGLGLALCKKMACLMGGDISCESILNQGSIFCLTLPISRSSTFSTAPRQEGGDALVDMRKTVVILVVDDHPVSRMLLVDQLRILGCIVDAAEHGEAALQKMESRAYDMVFTDLQMRVMDGYALSSRIRQSGKRIPVIVVTSHASEEDKRKCHIHGVAEVLFKPASLNDISTAIIANIGNHRGNWLSASSPEPQSPPHFRHALMAAAYQSMKTIRRYHDPEAAASIFQEMHAMKGSFAMANHAEVVEVLTGMEVMLRSGDVARFSSSLQDLEQILDGL